MSDTEHNIKMKFSMQTYLTYINTIGILLCINDHKSVM